MGRPPFVGGNLFDDPDDFDQLIEALGAYSRRFEISETLEDEAPSDVEAFDEADNEVLGDLAPLSLEELKMLLASHSNAYHRRRLKETAITRMVMALCFLGGIGAVLFIVTGSTAFLIAVLAFFAAEVGRLLNSG